MMESRRKFIKNSPMDSKHRWHDRFRKEYADKFREARNNVINKNRENQWMQRAIALEWGKFVKENEEAMKREGLLDIESLIEESYELDQQSLDDYTLNQLQEQEELDCEVAYYETSKESVICANCRKTNLIPSSKHNVPIALCPNCGFYATQSCLNEILHAVSAHSNACTGTIAFSLEPGTDNTIIGNCEACDLWDMFYM